MILDEKRQWQQVKEGNQVAFRQLHQQHLRFLLNYGLRLHGTLSTVEDTVQELFMELWQHRHTLTEPESVRFYLLKCLRNKLSRQYRRDQPFVSGWDTVPEPLFLVEPSAEQRLIDLTNDEELRQLVHQAMASLTPRQREILYLRYFNDLTYEEICDVMGITYQTARTQMYQALKNLRHHLDHRLPMWPLLVLYGFS